MFVGRFLERLQREAASTAEDDDVVADDDEQVALLQDASDEDDADEGNADDGENADVEDGDAVEDPEEEVLLEEEIPWWLAVCNLETLKTPAVYFALVSTNPRASGESPPEIAPTAQRAPHCSTLAICLCERSESAAWVGRS